MPDKLKIFRLTSNEVVVLAVLLFVVILTAQCSPRAAGAEVPAQALSYQRQLIREVRAQFGINAPAAVFAAQIHQESGWHADARSPVGARGLAQFMPATAAWMCGRHQDLPPGCDVLTPAWAMRALVEYDRDLYGAVRGHGECDRYWFTLRAYNGGLVNLNSERRLATDPLSRVVVDAQCGMGLRDQRFCAENTGYPRRILVDIQPAYAAWGPQVECRP